RPEGAAGACRRDVPSLARGRRPLIRTARCAASSPAPVPQRSGGGLFAARSAAFPFRCRRGPGTLVGRLLIFRDLSNERHDDRTPVLAAMSTLPDPKQDLALAVEAVRAAGAEVRARFGLHGEVRFKRPDQPVTEA